MEKQERGRQRRGREEIGGVERGVALLDGGERVKRGRRTEDGGQLW